MTNRQKLTALVILCMVFGKAENSFVEQLKKYSGEAGPELSYFVYEEPHFAEFRGFLTGITGAFTYHDGLMMKTEARFGFGSLYYTAPESGIIKNVPDYIAEFR